MTALSSRLEDELGHPIKVAMGLHAGPHVIGRIGHRDSRTMSVVGLAVNVASRMETMAKNVGAQIAITGSVAKHANLDVRTLRTEEAEVRGLDSPVSVIVLDRARDLVGLLRQPATVDG